MGTSDLVSVLAGIAGFLLSILAHYWPWFRNLSDTDKRVAMALLLILAAGVVYGLSCLGWLALVLPNIAMTCDQPGLATLISALFAALVTNQSTYTLFYSGKKVRTSRLPDA